MRDNPSLVAELNVHGNRQYEAAVMERVAKFQAICNQIQENHQAEQDVPEVVADDTNENLLINDDSEDEFIVTDFLLVSNDLDGSKEQYYDCNNDKGLVQEKTNKNEVDSSLEFPLTAPDKTIDESNEEIAIMQ